MIEFSEDEDEEEEGGITIKNAAKYLQYKPPQRGGYSNKVDETKYFNAIAKQAPNLPKVDKLKKLRKEFMARHNKLKDESKN